VLDEGSAEFISNVLLSGNSIALSPSIDCAWLSLTRHGCTSSPALSAAFWKWP